jgi:hypothetical protein
MNYFAPYYSQCCEARAQISGTPKIERTGAFFAIIIYPHIEGCWKKMRVKSSL